MDSLIEAADLYLERFGVNPPLPVNVNYGKLEEEIRRAVRQGEPIPDDFDWWGDLPEGAVS